MEKVFPLDVTGAHEPEHNAHDQQKSRNQPSEHVPLKQPVMFIETVGENKRRNDATSQGPMKNTGGKIPNKNFMHK